jgi:hypothetical protein
MDEIKQLTAEFKEGKRKTFNSPYTAQAVVEEDEQKKSESSES